MFGVCSMVVVELIFPASVLQFHSTPSFEILLPGSCMAARAIVGKYSIVADVAFSNQRATKSNQINIVIIRCYHDNRCTSVQKRTIGVRSGLGKRLTNSVLSVYVAVK